MKKHKIFCKGIICKKTDRKFICFDCGCHVCSICSIKEGKKVFCINCYLKSFNPHWEKLNKEFDEMLISLNLKKGIKDGEKLPITI